MCGKIKIEETAYQIGSSIPTLSLRMGADSEAIWSGFARTEKLAWWRKAGRGEMVVIPGTHFNEQGTEFRVGDTGKILGMLLGSDVEIEGKIVARAGEVRVVTRSAETTTEKNIHDRWPVVLTPNTKSCYLFNEQDVEADEP